MNVKSIVSNNVKKAVSIHINQYDELNKGRRFLFNEVSDIVKEHKVPVSFHTGTGIIEFPSATQEILAGLKKLGVCYKEGLYTAK